MLKRIDKSNKESMFDKKIIKEEEFNLFIKKLCVSAAKFIVDDNEQVLANLWRSMQSRTLIEAKNSESARVDLLEEAAFIKVLC